jgi:hypothetical protein
MLSLRNDRFKFTTLENLLVILEEGINRIYLTLLEGKPKRYQHVTGIVYLLPKSSRKSGWWGAPTPLENPLPQKN